MNAKPLQGRVVMLVGVGSAGPVPSNGRASAIAFAKAGAHLILVDIDEGALIACEKAVRSSGGSSSLIACDVTVESDVQGAVTQALAQHPLVDVLHFNVATTKPGRLTQSGTHDFDQMFSINVRSAVWLSKYLLPSMEAARHGVFTFVSSISSIRYLGIPSPLYDMSKAAINALSRHIAAHYGPKGVRSNALLLGMMDTPLARRAIERAGRQADSIYERYITKIPTARMGSANDVGDASVFLASDGAAYINGAELLIDGGLTVTSA